LAAALDPTAFSNAEPWLTGSGQVSDAVEFGEGLHASILTGSDRLYRNFVVFVINVLRSCWMAFIGLSQMRNILVADNKM